MKKCLAVLLLLPLLLGGCGRENRELQQMMDLRSELLAAEGCRFSADITADYGDSLEQFSVSCQGDALGNLHFTVTAPETIAGITGKLSDSGGKLTFDDKALQFSLLTDGQLSPVSGPWIFLKTLRSGYLLSAGKDGEQIRVSARDSYREDGLLLDLWLDPAGVPVRGEILHNGRRILTLAIRDFQIPET